MSLITDAEQKEFDRGKQIALDNYALKHGSVEKSFEQQFLDQGHPPEKAARMAKTAAQGHVYDPRGF